MRGREAQFFCDAVCAVCGFGFGWCAARAVVDLDLNAALAAVAFALGWAGWQWNPSRDRSA